MCGIAGFMGQVENRADVIRNMTEVITHRGPDSDGFFTDDNISMGFRRLSIIDLGAGHQPIYNEDKSLVLTFNGEIYNYKDLRKELIAKGHKFYTDTDSEVLVHGFEEWKEDMLPKLRGMFGFAIYNTKDNSLFIARDFFGIKPMHYTQIGNDFVYASEIKSILEYPKFEKKFNRKALDSYLSFQYAVPPETFFEGVYCLMPGHYLWYKDGEVETTRYFEARFNPDEEMTEEEAVDRIEKVFENSVNAHKIADVEVGCFLSSGVDSSYVSTYFADQKTFTVGFDFGEKYNEISWAKNLSEKIGVEHHTHLISSEEFWDAVPTVQYHMDQPLAFTVCLILIGAESIDIAVVPQLICIFKGCKIENILNCINLINAHSAYCGSHYGTFHQDCIAVIFLVLNRNKVAHCCSETDIHNIICLCFNRGCEVDFIGIVVIILILRSVCVILRTAEHFPTLWINHIKITRLFEHFVVIICKFFKSDCVAHSVYIFTFFANVRIFCYLCLIKSRKFIGRIYYTRNIGILLVRTAEK